MKAANVLCTKICEMLYARELDPKMCRTPDPYLEMYHALNPNPELYHALHQKMCYVMKLPDPNLLGRTTTSYKLMLVFFSKLVISRFYS